MNFGFKVEVASEFEHLDVFSFPYMRGYWDGSFSENDDGVGLGWWIEAAFVMGRDGEPEWLAKPLLTARGRARGRSAVAAELLAHCCLVESVSRCLWNPQSLFEPYLPWEADTFPIDVDPHDAPLCRAPVKIEWRDAVEVDGDFPSSSSSSSSSAMSANSDSGNDEAEMGPQPGYTRHLDYFGPEDFEEENELQARRVRHLEYFGPEDFEIEDSVNALFDDEEAENLFLE